MAIDFPEIDPVAIALGPIEIRWYALAYLAGFLLGWKYCLYLSQKYFEPLRPNREDFDDFLTWAVVGVILGGRFGYVLFYQFEYYSTYPMEALKVWNGGMSFHGGMLGVIIAMISFAYVRKIPLLKLSDLVAMAVPIGLFFGRLANFINGELFGRVTSENLPWGIRFPNAPEFPRHPSQIYEAILEGLVLFTVLFALYRSEFIRKHAGIVTGVFLIGYGSARSFVELYREPDGHLGLFWGVISMGQILSLPMIIAGLSIVGYALVVIKRQENVRDEI